MEKEKQKTQQYTTEDALENARILAEPSKTDKQRKKVFLENFASLITVFVVSLTVVLYSYNKGVCSIYNLPIECMLLDLKSYIPVAISLLGVFGTVSFYMSFIKTDIALKRKRFNLVRVLYGFIFMDFLIRINNINHFLSVKYTIAISIIAAFLLELCVFAYLHFYFSPKKSKPLSRSEYNLRIEDFVRDRFIYAYLVKYGVFILILATLIAPILGRISAKAKQQYQIVESNNSQFTVIVEYSDRVLVQPATIEEGVLRIETNQFEYLPKDNLILQYNEFNQVIIE